MTAVDENRGLLMNVAYRLLGSVSEAEDAVQEAFARWYAMSDAGRAAIDSPAAWLVTVTTRICLDVLGSARARRERYVGEWLPEPVPSDARWTSQAAAASVSADPADRRLPRRIAQHGPPRGARSDDARGARSPFVLHDVFRYTFAEVAEIVGRSPQACRQLASSARRRIRDARRTQITTQEHARVVSAFATALETGDLTSLVGLLDPDATAIADGGGLVAASIEPIEGADTIARYLLDLYARGVTFRITTVNGRAGLVGSDGSGEPLAVASLAITGGRIERIWVTRNPEKLAGWR